MRKLLLILALFTLLAQSQTTSFYTDRAAAPTPIRGFSLLAPISYGQVRVCQLPLTQTQPCLPLANITDINNNPISNSIGGNFGQVTADVTGRFTFGCQVNLNYQLQVAPAASNTPQLNYPITCPGTGANPLFTSIGAQTIGSILYVGPGGYSTIAAAVTAAGSTKTLGIIQNNYAGGDCPAQVANLMWLDLRGGAAPCNASSVTSFNNNDTNVYSGIRSNFVSTTIPAAGSLVAMWPSTFYTGTGGSMNGNLVDGFAATAFINGSFSGGTLAILRGNEISASIQSLLGTVTLAEGATGYVAGIGTSTTAIGTVRGIAGYGCNGQTYGLAPANCYGGEFLSQQGKGTTRNYSLAWNGPAIARFDGVSTTGGVDCEDAAGVAHPCIRIDSSSNVNIDAIATNVNLSDSGFTARAQVNGSVFKIPTACSIANTRPNESPVPLCASTLQKAETGADATVLSYTPVAAAGTYRVCISMAVSAQNTATLGWTATWTDSNGSAQAPTNLALTQTGVAAPALTFTAATNGNYTGCQTVDINNGAVAIVVKTTFSGTSIAYKTSATIERMI